MVSNHRPLLYQSSALPLSYGSEGPLRSAFCPISQHVAKRALSGKNSLTKDVLYRLSYGSTIYRDGSGGTPCDATT